MVQTVDLKAGEEDRVAGWLGGPWEAPVSRWSGGGALARVGTNSSIPLVTKRPTADGQGSLGVSAAPPGVWYQVSSPRVPHLRNGNRAEPGKCHSAEVVV